MLLFKSLFSSLLNLLYPPFCLHCGGAVDTDSDLLCHTCGSLLELCDPKERCSCCFKLDIDTQNGRAASQAICYSCLKSDNLSLFHATASAFDHWGPAASLIRQFKYGKMPQLGSGLSAYMAIQYQQLEWPLPDIITPVPQTIMRRLERGYNQSLILAQGLSTYLQVPAAELLGRKCGDPCQAALPRATREALSNKNIVLLDDGKVRGKSILVVDDVMTTGSTLNACAKTLLYAAPKALYALTATRSPR